MISYIIDGKRIFVYPAAGPDRPVIYLNTFAQEADGIYRELKAMKSPDCTLAAICDLDWNRDMAPWECPPISKDDTPCVGGADDFLNVLTEKIVPEVEKDIEIAPLWRGICGYSLAGLFAVYSIYNTDLFSRAASMSGSLWFPGFKEYVFSHDMKGCTDHIYFSLGNKEARTPNPFLKSVQDDTAEIQKFYEEHGIDSVFVLNPGNHYVDPEKRTAAGIDWILRR